jgi:hypothetical protein
MTDRRPFSTPLRLLDDARPAPRERAAGPSASPLPHRTPAPPLLDEPSLFYDPPYADPVHDTFAWHLVKYLKPGSGLRHQVDGPRAPTVDLGIDFVVEQGTWRVGFMCGASDAGREHDRRCDALRIGQAAVDVLYRLRAEDVEARLHDALLLVAKWDAALFSERGRINLNTLATSEARAVHPGPDDTVVTVAYDAAREAVEADTLRIVRVSRSHPEGWRPVYEQARRAAGLPAGPPPKRWARSA